MSMNFEIVPSSVSHVNYTECIINQPLSLTCSEAMAAPASEVTGWSGGEMEGTRSSPLLLLPPLAELLSGAETAAGAVTFWPPPMKSSRCLWTDRY